jgi:hypothetical protein
MRFWTLIVVLTTIIVMVHLQPVHAADSSACADLGMRLDQSSLNFLPGDILNSKYERDCQCTDLDQEFHFEAVCTNYCATCSNSTDLCGVWQVDLTEDSEKQMYKYCMNGKQGAVSGDMVCLSEMYVISSGEQTCTISVNGTDCNYCQIILCKGTSHYVADCLNIFSGAEVNTCTGEGLVGPFAVFADDVVKSGEVGTCDVDLPTSSAIVNGDGGLWVIAVAMWLLL